MYVLYVHSHCAADNTVIYKNRKSLVKAMMYAPVSVKPPRLNFFFFFLPLCFPVSLAHDSPTFLRHTVSRPALDSYSKQQALSQGPARTHITLSVWELW